MSRPTDYPRQSSELSNSLQNYIEIITYIISKNSHKTLKKPRASALLPTIKIPTAFRPSRSIVNNQINAFARKVLVIRFFSQLSEPTKKKKKKNDRRQSRARRSPSPTISENGQRGQAAHRTHEPARRECSKKAAKERQGYTSLRRSERVIAKS